MNLSQFKSVWEKEGKDPVKVIELFMQAALEYGFRKREPI